VQEKLCLSRECDKWIGPLQAAAQCFVLPPVFVPATCPCYPSQNRYWATHQKWSSPNDGVIELGRLEKVASMELYPARIVWSDKARWWLIAAKPDSVIAKSTLRKPSAIRAHTLMIMIP
jgi:hypothetical protein